MNKLQNAEKVLEGLPAFLTSSAAEGLPIEKELVEKIEVLLAQGVDPTDAIEAFYEEKLNELK